MYVHTSVNFRQKNIKPQALQLFPLFSLYMHLSPHLDKTCIAHLLIIHVDVFPLISQETCIYSLITHYTCRGITHVSECGCGSG